MPSSELISAGLNFQIGCELSQVRRAAERLREFMAGRACSESEIRDCEVALVEACNNAIQYAPKAARRLPVDIQVLCDVREIELRITDHTRGFDWPAEASLPPPEAERGRGVFLIKKLMDFSEYLRGAERNVLIVRKGRKTVR